MISKTFICKEHGEFTITEKQDKDVLSYLNYNCPTCNKISMKSESAGLFFKGDLPNMKN